MSFPLNGEDRMIRLRGHEVNLIDEKCISKFGRSLYAMLKEETFGPSFIHIVVDIGLRHQYMGQGKKKQPTDEQLANWISDIERVDGVPYADFVQALMKTLTDAMPQGKREDEGNAPAVEEEATA
jgi:hypothetical protein